MASLQVKRKTSITVTETFTANGSPIDLDSGVPTVVSTAPDGTTTTYNAGTTPAVTHVGALNSGQYQLVMAGQSEVTWRGLTWTGTIGGQSQTLESRVEWVGDLLFTLAQFRAFKVAGGAPFSSSATYSDQAIMDARAEVLDEFTDILGYSPVPRFGREVITLDGCPVVLAQHKIIQLLTLKVAGVSQTVSGFYVTTSGVLTPVSGYYPTIWSSYGYGALACEYVHGTATIPGGGSTAAKQVAAAKLLPDVFSSASSVSTPDGVSISYEPAEVGRSGYQRWYGIRDVDRFLNRASERVPV